MCLLLLQALQLTYLDFTNSPGMNEPGHLVAGISYWHFGTFRFYNVNTPLVRLLASAPIAVQRPELDWRRVSLAPGARSDFDVGEDFFRANGDCSLSYLIQARLVLIPVILWGGWVCYRWSSEAYGEASGVIALALWTFCPNVIGWGATLASDASGAAIGVAACRSLYQALKCGSLKATGQAGVLIGAAILAKPIWLFLPILSVPLWIAFRSLRRISLRADLSSLLVLQTAMLIMINAGYGLEGTMRPLGGYQFRSSAFSGLDQQVLASGQLGNRFPSIVHGLPVPLPSEFLYGLDEQKQRFEVGMTAYLMGEFSERGWWFYYPCAAIVKVPIGTWLLLAAAIAVSVFLWRDYCPEWEVEACLICPVLFMALILLSQDGISRYCRYALPCAPLVFIWVSKIGRAIRLGQKRVAFATLAFTTWNCVSGLVAFPYSLSYFNEIAGGFHGGNTWLDDSNVDWGQDFLRLRTWCGRHREASPLGADVLTPLPYLLAELPVIPVDLTALADLEVNASDRKSASAEDHRVLWLAVSAHRILDPAYKTLRGKVPVDKIGSTIDVYRLEVPERQWLRLVRRR